MLQSLTVASLVFGVGYIGSRLVQELLFDGQDVVACDNFFSCDRRAIDGFAQSSRFCLVEGSITDPVAIERTLDALPADVEGIYFLAAQSSAHPDAATAHYTEEVNLRGPRLVVEAVLRRGIRAPIVYASSIRVYGSPLPEYVDEATPFGAFTDLSHLTKCYAEKLFQLYALRDGATSRVVRLGLTYGIAPVMKVDRLFMTAPNLFCFQAARGETLVVRNSDPVGLIHVDAAAQALRWAATTVEAESYTVYNSPCEFTSIDEVAGKVRDIAARRNIVVAVDCPTQERKVRRQPPTFVSTMASRGFRDRKSLEDGLGETFDHFLVKDR